MQIDLAMSQDTPADEFLVWCKRCKGGQSCRTHIGALRTAVGHSKKEGHRIGIYVRIKLISGRRKR